MTGFLIRYVLFSALISMIARLVAASEERDAMRGKTVHGHDVEASTEHLDGEWRVSVRVTKRGVAAGEAACRVFVPAGEAPELHAAFHLDALPCALPEDVAEQEAAVAALGEALRRTMGSHAPIDDLRAAWALSRDRMQARWRENAAAGGPTLDGLCVIERRNDVVLGLATRTTRPNREGWVGVCRENGGWHDLRQGDNPVLPTADLLARANGLSGHDKLRLLRGEPVAPPPEALKEFEWQRSRGGTMEPSRPLRDPTRTILAYQDRMKTAVFFPDGGSGFLLHEYCTTNAKLAFFEMPDEGCEIGIHGGIDQPLLVKALRHGRREQYCEPDQLERGLRRVVEMILLDDRPVSLDNLLLTNDAFDPAHPLLTGFDVPQRHQEFVGMILGAAYTKSREQSEASRKKRLQHDAMVAARKAEAAARQA